MESTTRANSNFICCSHLNIIPIIYISYIYNFSSVYVKYIVFKNLLTFHLEKLARNTKYFLNFLFKKVFLQNGVDY